MSGPSSDCGSSGQKQVTTEDQVQFYFKSSKKSNNGTDVNAGQLPQILYKMITNERPTTHRRRDPQEPICILTPKFAKKVTPSCFKALLSLIEWSWKALKVGILQKFIKFCNFMGGKYFKKFREITTGIIYVAISRIFFAKRNTFLRLHFNI